MSAESTDRLYDEGCCLCGTAFTRGDSERMLHQEFCVGCSKRYNFAAVNEVERRKSLVPRPAPAEKFKVGDWVEWTESSGIRYVGRVNRVTDRMVYADDVSVDKFREWCALLMDAKPWQPQPGEWCEGQATHGSRVGAGKVVRGKFLNLTQDKSPVLDCPDETEDNGIDRAHRVKVRADSLRPIPPQLAPGSAGSVDAAHRETAADPPGDAVAGSTQPTEPGHSLRDEMAAGDALVAAAVLARDAEYRKRVASVLSDLDRSSSSRREAIGRHASDWDVDDAPENIVS